MAGAEKVPDASTVAPWGTPPKGATRWQCHRHEQGKWEPCLWYETGANVAGRVWPLSDLSVQAIGARWGAGRYRLTWQGEAAVSRDTKRPPSLGTSSIFTVDGFPVRALYPNAPGPDAPPAAPAPLSLPGDSAGAMFQLIWNTTEKHHASVLSAHVASNERAMSWLATMYGAEAQRAREHQSAMLSIAKQGHSREVSELAAVVSSLAAQVKALAARLDDEDEDEPVVGAAKPGEEKDLLTRLGEIGVEALEQFGPEVVGKVLGKLGVIKPGDDDK